MLTKACPKRSQAWQLKRKQPHTTDCVPPAYPSVSKEKPSMTAQVKQPHTKVCLLLSKHVQREAKHDSSSETAPHHRLCASCLTKHVQGETKHDRSSKTAHSTDHVPHAYPSVSKEKPNMTAQVKQPHTTNCVPHAYPSMSKEKPSMTAQVETAPHHTLCASRLPKHVQREAKHDSSSGNSPTPHTVCLTLTQACPKRSQAWQLKWKQPHTTHCVPHAYPSMSKEKPSMTAQVETAPHHTLCASCLPKHVQREAKHDSSSGNSPTPHTVCPMLTQACPKRSQAWQLKWKQPHTTHCVPHAYPSMSKENPSMTAQVETAPHHRLCASRLPKHVQREAKHDRSSGNSPIAHSICLVIKI